LDVNGFRGLRKSDEPGRLAGSGWRDLQPSLAVGCFGRWRRRRSERLSGEEQREQKSKGAQHGDLLDQVAASCMKSRADATARAGFCKDGSFLPTPGSRHLIGRPPHLIERPPHSIERPPRLIERPPHLIGRPPHLIGRPPRLIGRPPRLIERPPRLIERPPR